MRVFGIDFTSRPTRRKPILCAEGRIEGAALVLKGLRAWDSFAPFEAMLASEGPWIAGMDFPFGLPRPFISAIGWPGDWAGYTRHAALLGRAGFRAALDGFRQGRPAGQREYRRAADVAAGAISPQKLYGVPVGLMYLEGAPRLLDSPVSIPLLKVGDPARVAIEAYPGCAVRQLIGRQSYKNDDPARQSPLHRAARQAVLEGLEAPANPWGLHLKVGPADRALLLDDPGADRLDAVICAMQAAWAWQRPDYGLPADADPDEGWIANPSLCGKPC